MPPGLRVAYASSSLAPASLEYFVNPDPSDAPVDLVSVRVEIPDEVKVDRVELASLPVIWRTTPGFPKPALRRAKRVQLRSTHVEVIARMRNSPLHPLRIQSSVSWMPSS